MGPGLWPNDAKAAVSFTMDNLGEAQDVRTGTWPADQPYGTHPAVLTILPRILDLLDATSTTTSTTTTTTITANPKVLEEVVVVVDPRPIRATYFAESWSLPIYPQAVTDLLQRGHEVAWHGFQHEVWHSLTPEEEEVNFARSFGQMKSAAAVMVVEEEEEEESNHHHHNQNGISLRYEGFRPPGGTLPAINSSQTTTTFSLLKQYGVRYVSPFGREFGIDEQTGIVILPFEWETVDAFWYMDKFAGIRKEHGVQEEALSPDAFKTYLFNKFDALVQEGGYISILFHPFLQTSEEKFKVVEEVLYRLSNDPAIWVAPCNEVATWVKEHADDFGFKA